MPPVPRHPPQLKRWRSRQPGQRTSPPASRRFRRNGRTSRRCLPNSVRCRTWQRLPVRSPSTVCVPNVRPVPQSDHLSRRPSAVVLSRTAVRQQPGAAPLPHPPRLRPFRWPRLRGPVLQISASHQTQRRPLAERPRQFQPVPPVAAEHQAPHNPARQSRHWVPVEPDRLSPVEVVQNLGPRSAILPETGHDQQAVGRSMLQALLPAPLPFRQRPGRGLREAASFQTVRPVLESDEPATVSRMVVFVREPVRLWPRLMEVVPGLSPGAQPDSPGA